jgi:hypothetical protein
MQRPVNQLHAATDLAWLWIERSERQKAPDLLAPILGWFTEGFDTSDLIDARGLPQGDSDLTKHPIFPFSYDYIRGTSPSGVCSWQILLQKSSSRGARSAVGIRP